MARGPGSALTVARIIASALAGGVVLFWIVAWVLTGGGQEGLAPDLALSPQLLFWLWAVVALCGFAGALVFRSRAVRAVESSRSPRGTEGARPGAAQVQTNLIVAWALLEGPALLGGVFFLLIASWQVLSTAALLYGIGLVLTFPRAEWLRDG